MFFESIPKPWNADILKIMVQIKKCTMQKSLKMSCWTFSVVK